MTTPLAKGQNGPLNTPEVVVSVDLTAPADVSALLVTSAGKVRSDADFVFFNQPTGPGVRLQPGGPGQPAALRVTLAEVPADIDQIRTVITLEDASATFGRFAPPTARVADGTGNRLYEYRIDGLATESIVIAIELYRRGPAWKVRAVGQGYAGGFAALVTDHGVSVDDEPAPAAPPAPPAPPAAPPAPPAAPPAPAYGSPAPSYGSPPPAPGSPAPDYGSPAPSYGSPAPSYGTPAPNYGGQPPAPDYGSPAPSYGSPAPSYGAPAPSYGTQPPPPDYGATAPAPSYGAPPQAPYGSPTGAQAAPAGGGGEISLSKSRPVSLAKGQRVSLRKDGGVALTRIDMGLGWDPVETRGRFGSRTANIDLDASAFLFAGGAVDDVIYYGRLSAKDGSIRHSGDNLTGEGGGDDEVVSIDLPAVSPHITSIVLTVTSYRGQTFEQVRNAYCRLVDLTTGAELARYTLQGGMPFTGMVMARVYREGAEWKLQAMGEGIQTKNPKQAAPLLSRFLG